MNLKKYLPESNKIMVFCGIVFLYYMGTQTIGPPSIPPFIKGFLFLVAVAIIAFIAWFILFMFNGNYDKWRQGEAFSDILLGKVTPKEAVKSNGIIAGKYLIRWNKHYTWYEVWEGNYLHHMFNNINEAQLWCELN